MLTHYIFKNKAGTLFPFLSYFLILLYVWNLINNIIYLLIIRLYIIGTTVISGLLKV